MVSATSPLPGHPHPAELNEILGTPPDCDLKPGCLGTPMYAGDDWLTWARRASPTSEDSSGRQRGSSSSSGDGDAAPVRVELSPSRQTALAAADRGAGPAFAWDSPPPGHDLAAGKVTPPTEIAATAFSATSVRPSPAAVTPAIQSFTPSSMKSATKAAVGKRASTVKASLSSRGITTLMIRNFPGHVTQKEVLDELSRGGFDGTFDFVYLPCSFDSRENKGYGFINFVGPELVGPFVEAWHNSRTFCASERDLALNVSAATIQGLEANIKRWSSRVQRIRNPELKPHIVPHGQPSRAPSAAPHAGLDLAATPDLTDQVGLFLAATGLAGTPLLPDFASFDLAYDLTYDLHGFGLDACRAHGDDTGAPYAFDIPPGLTLPPGIYDGA